MNFLDLLVPTPASEIRKFISKITNKTTTDKTNEFGMSWDYCNGKFDFTFRSNARNTSENNFIGKLFR